MKLCLRLLVEQQGKGSNRPFHHHSISLVSSSPRSWYVYHPADREVKPTVVLERVLQSLRVLNSNLERQSGRVENSEISTGLSYSDLNKEFPSLHILIAKQHHFEP